jgi:hypothetical protein
MDRFNLLDGGTLGAATTSARRAVENRKIPRLRESDLHRGLFVPFTGTGVLYATPSGKR